MLHVVLNDQMVTGGIIITVAAVLATACLLLTLLHIFLTFLIPAYAHRMSSSQERNFILSPLGFYIICLFGSNLITSIGGVMEAQWVGARAITQGPVCSTQAFTLQLGNNAAALWTAVISISAMRTFMFRARPLSKTVALSMIFLLWIAMITIDGLASTIFADHSGSFFYGIAGMWCWITPSHRTARLVMQYIWMWAWSLVSAACFFFVFLSVRGNITVKRDGRGRSVRWNKRAFNSYALGSGEEQYGVLVGAVGKTMCWFPISYITLTLPISVSRVCETFGFSIPSYAFVFSAVSFLLLGIVSPILYFAIRHSLKHASSRVISDATLHGSFGDKLDAESFHTPQDKRPSPVSKFGSYPWTPTPTTREWVPPSPHHGITEVTSPSSTVPYARSSSGEESLSAYRMGTAPASVSSKFAQRPQPSHRPMDSISTVTSSGTVVGPVVRLSPVTEGESPTESELPQLTLPLAALVSRRQSLQSPDVVLPSDLDKFTNVPLSPGLRRGHKRSDTDASVYSGPRAISPDLNALLQASQTPISPTGPPPPPRKTRRSPIPSVPVDVDESDQGSICSAPPSAKTFEPEDSRPMSIGDVATRNPARRVDSMRTSNIPVPADAATLNRDTMRTFWAAYEDPSPITTNMTMPSLVAQRETMLDSNVTSPDSLKFQYVDPSVSIKPSLSAVGGAPADKRTPIPTLPSKVIGSHQRSRSSTEMPTPPVAALYGSAKLQSSNSATARFNGPYARKTPTPTPSETNQSSDGSYRTPRPQPGYL